MFSQKPRILTIDDSPSNLLTLGAMLAENFEVQTATSGPQGIELAGETLPDLILLDVIMPGMDGLETCRRIKADPTLRDIPIIFVTGANTLETELAGLALGGADYISKPINIKTARQRINNLLERESLRKKVEAQRDQLETTLTQLQQSEERFRQAFVHAPFGMALVAMDGNLEAANPALCRMTGYRDEELCGLAISALFVDHRLEGEATLVEQLSNGIISSISEEKVGIHKDGRLFPVSKTWSPVRDANNNPLNFIVQIEDITERKQIQLKDLATGILVAQEKERARLSHELHDEIGQSLTALKILLKRTQQRANEQDRVVATLDEGQRMLEHLMEDVRGIAYRLRPSELDQLGLVAALRSHLDKTVRPLGHKVTLVENIGDARLPTDLELCCFRVVQEALTNGLRHSQVDHLEVSLQRDSSRLTLSIKDEGVGFELGRYYSAHEHSSSLGLIGMRERVSANGGELTIRSAPGQGTEITATFDLDRILP